MLHKVTTSMAVITFNPPNYFGFLRNQSYMLPAVPCLLTFGCLEAIIITWWAQYATDNPQRRHGIGNMHWNLWMAEPPVWGLLSTCAKLSGMPLKGCTKDWSKSRCMGHLVPALLYFVLSHQECQTKRNSTVFSTMVNVPVRISDNFTFVIHHTV
jgi:hypothetical protein